MPLSPKQAVMNIKLGANAYGKNAINLSKIIRHEHHHEFRQISVSVSLQGPFETTHTAGDNSTVLPTDTQKNTVYALAKEHFVASIESFGSYLAAYFMNNNPQIDQCTIQITEHGWQQMLFNGQSHPHAYISSGSEKHMAVIVQNRAGTTISAGIKDLLILKTTDSAFEHYIKDRFTTLPETSDRILATNCETSWVYGATGLDFTPLYADIRNTLLQTFAGHKSQSVQHTLYAMGEAVLKEYDAVKEISLKMPNKHHILYNLQQFGMENHNEIFMATDEPYGYIAGTVVRV